jgi:hypothetical protein
MIRSYGAKILLCLATVIFSLVAGQSAAHAQFWPPREMLRGYSEVYSVSEQGPVYLYVWFRRYPSGLSGRRTLDRVTFDFAGHPVHFDVDGRPVEIITNNFVNSATFFPMEDSQVFGFTARSFRSRGTVICKLDLDRDPAQDANPFTKDMLGGTITFHFSGRLEIAATFDRQGSFGDRTVKAEFSWMGPRPGRRESSARCRPRH